MTHDDAIQVCAAMAQRDTELIASAAKEYVAKYDGILALALELAFIKGASFGCDLRSQSSLEIVNDVFRENR